MKHMKKIACSLMALALVSCGGNGSVVGRYKFQLGSDKGTHMGIYMDLTDEEVKSASTGKSLGNKFELSVDMKGMADEEVEALFADEKENRDQAFKMGGYYNVGTGDAEGILFLGTTIIEDFFEITIDIDSSLVEKILYATIDSGAINVCIPVSLNDLAFQLYWYGYRIDIQNIFESELPIEELPADQHHQTGTHPTATDIKTIRETEIAKGLSVNMFEEYRDYHTLTMGLRK